MTTQIRRSIVYVPSNIAEGYGRQYRSEYLRFLKIARGSLYEFQSQLEIVIYMNYMNECTINEIKQEHNEIERMLNSLINKLNTNYT
ncbi:MAG: four helix bundle protein [Bacteroidales bacterium]|nr:four helix bundle protein [Bacteroidales bacterium]